MSLTAITLVQNLQLPASIATQYTAPANSKVIIRHAIFTNTTGGAITVTAELVPNAGTAGAPATVMSAQSIAAGGTYVSPELAGIVMNAGDTLQCFASAATSISMNASGILQQ